MEDIIAHLKQLQSQNVDFSTLSITEQLQIKERRSRPDLDLQQRDSSTGNIRKFNRKWYDTYPWLTGSESLKKLFCLDCAVFGGDRYWSQDGTDYIRNFANKCDKHQNCKRHIKNRERFLMIGKTEIFREKEKLTAVGTQKQIEQETQRRELMSQIIDSIFILIRRQKNYKVSNLMKFVDELTTEKFAYQPGFKEMYDNMYGDLYEKLIPSMESVMLEDIKREISETEFCSIQTDEIPNKTGNYAVIVRYAHNGLIKERFVGFFEIQKTFDLAQIINVIIGDARKLVCHSYDGSVPMKFVRHGIKSIIPKVFFHHNYMHKLNTLLIQGVQNIKECKTFSNQVTSICDFFRETKRSALLRKKGVLLPTRRETLWMFNSKAVSIIIKNYAKISKVLNIIIVSLNCFDLDTRHLARSVQNSLKDHMFVLLSCLFNKIFVYTDHLSNAIQRKMNLYVESSIQDVAQTVKSISNFKTETIIKHCVDETKTHLKIETIPDSTIDQFKKTAFSIIDSVVDQIEERFLDCKFLKFVELFDSSRFLKYTNKFPKPPLQHLVDIYPELFDNIHLESELSIIYRHTTKKLNAYQLFSYLYDNGLSELYKETYKVLRLYLTFPLTTPTNLGETCSTLTRVRNYLNHTEGQIEEKPALLFVEKYSNESSDYSLFKSRVINQFDQ